MEAAALVISFPGSSLGTSGARLEPCGFTIYLKSVQADFVCHAPPWRVGGLKMWCRTLRANATYGATPFELTAAPANLGVEPGA